MFSAVVARYNFAVVLSQKAPSSSSNTLGLAFHHTSPCPRRSTRQRHGLTDRRLTNYGDNNLSKPMQSCSSFELETSQSYYYYSGGDSKNNDNIAYRYFSSSGCTGSHVSPAPIIIFLNGLLSNMSGTKSRSLQRYAKDKGANFLCFDYRGHGNSSGLFVDCTMHDWVEDARTMLDHSISLSSEMRRISGARDMIVLKELHEWIEPKVILVGSSMGAWIALRLALERPQLITGVIGVGSAIDFTHDTYRKLDAEQRKALLSGNQVVDISSPYLDEPYSFSNALFDSGHDYLLCHDSSAKDADILNSGSLKLSCRVRFLHGTEDDVVNWSTVTNAVETLRLNYHSEDIDARLLYGGDHRLSRTGDISIMLETLDEFL